MTRLVSLEKAGVKVLNPIGATTTNNNGVFDIQGCVAKNLPISILVVAHSKNWESVLKNLLGGNSQGILWISEWPFAICECVLVRFDGVHD